VGLEGEAQAAFNAASQELAELATAFGNRVLDATNAWTLRLSDPAEVEGLPESLKEQLAQAARDAGDGEATARSQLRVTRSLPPLSPAVHISCASWT